MEFEDTQEFDSEHLHFGSEDKQQIKEANNSMSMTSKAGLEDSRDLSKINQMYDVLYTDDHTIFNLGEHMRKDSELQKDTIFGLEEDAKLGDNEQVRITNTIVKSTGGSKHTDYKIVGRLGDENFVIMRRYKEFDVLHKRLEERWPGFYIPPIPKKVAFGKMSNKVVAERMHALNRFLIEISERKYLWESEEVSIFIKPETNVTYQLKMLPRLTVEQILERIKTEADINLHVDPLEMSQHQKLIMDFKNQVIANLPFLANFKAFLIKQCAVTDQYLCSNGFLMDQLYKFEKGAIELYCNYDDETETKENTFKVISDIENERVGTDFYRFPLTVKNPFLMAKYWIKQEILDLEAALRCIEST